MLFLSDCPLDDDLSCDPESVKNFLRSHTDAQLCNDYIFLKCLDYGYLYSDADFVRPLDKFGSYDDSGCYYDSFIGMLNTYLEYLYDEVMHRFIIKTRESITKNESEVTSDEVSTSTVS